MELWFSEQHTPDVKLSIKVERQLCGVESSFQRIDVFESPEFGRFLTLDGYMMLTEKDEFIYHEMMVHVPMAVHPRVRSVLVIGGGDGGIVRELVKYPRWSGSTWRKSTNRWSPYADNICRESPAAWRTAGSTSTMRTA